MEGTERATTTGGVGEEVILGEGTGVVVAVAAITGCAVVRVVVASVAVAEDRVAEAVATTANVGSDAGGLSKGAPTTAITKRLSTTPPAIHGHSGRRPAATLAPSWAASGTSFSGGLPVRLFPFPVRSLAT